MKLCGRLRRGRKLNPSTAWHGRGWLGGWLAHPWATADIHDPTRPRLIHHPSAKADLRNSTRQRYLHRSIVRTSSNLPHAHVSALIVKFDLRIKLFEQRAGDDLDECRGQSPPPAQLLRRN
jgi:hypothetical protein